MQGEVPISLCMHCIQIENYCNVFAPSATVLRYSPGVHRAYMHIGLQAIYQHYCQGLPSFVSLPPWEIAPL